MNPEYLPWAIVLLLAGAGILFLRDALQRKKTRGNEPASGFRRPVRVRDLLTVILLVAAFSLARAAGRPGRVVVLVAGALFLVYIGYLIRKPAGYLLKCLFTGRRPHFIRRLADGQMTVRCPRCRTTVLLQPGAPGDVAGECPFCHEKMRWLRDGDSSDRKSHSSMSAGQGGQGPSPPSGGTESPNSGEKEHG